MMHYMSNQDVTINVPNKPLKNLEKVLRRAEKDIKNGNNLSPLFVGVEKIDQYLINLINL